jgi:hypothetical protein
VQIIQLDLGSNRPFSGRLASSYAGSSQRRVDLASDSGGTDNRTSGLGAGVARLVMLARDASIQIVEH